MALPANAVVPGASLYPGTSLYPSPGTVTPVAPGPVPVVGRVEVEFVDGTWTDVTTWWDARRPVTMTGGRSDTDERVQPGRLSGLMLDTTDGRFTAGNPASPYWPNVVSGRRVRVSVQDPGDGTYYPRWTGTIDGWPLTWADNGSTCWVTMSATDALLPLAEPLQGWLQLCHQRAGYSHYWPMTDNDEALQHAEMLTGGASLGPVGDPTACTEAGPSGDPSPLPNGGTYVGWWSGQLPGDATAWWASCLFKSTAKGVPFVPLRASSGGLAPMQSEGYELGAYVTAEGYLCAARHDPGLEWTVSTPGVLDICDGSWWRLLITGTADDDDDSGFFAGAYRVDDPNTNTGGYLGGITATRALLGVPVFVGVGQRATVGHLGWATGESAPVFDATWFTAVAGGPMGTVGADYNAMSPYPVTVTYPGAEYATMFARPVPATWSDWWAQVEAVDGGVTVAERDGTRTYLGGGWRTRARSTTAIPLALTADQIGPDLTVAVDRFKLCNNATVVARDAFGVQRGAVRLTDTASVARSGRRARSADVYGTRAQGGLTNIAAALLAPTEAPRIPTITVDALAGGGTVQQALLLGEAGDPVGVWSLVAVAGLPTAGGFQSQWLGRVEGWTETLGVDQWTVTFTTSYAGAVVGDPTFAVVGTARVG